MQELALEAMQDAAAPAPATMTSPSSGVSDAVAAARLVMRRERTMRTDAEAAAAKATEALQRTQVSLSAASVSSF
jgi:hypothetical protein